MAAYEKGRNPLRDPEPAPPDRLARVEADVAALKSQPSTIDRLARLEADVADLKGARVPTSPKEP